VVEEKAIMREPIGYKEHILPGILCYPLLFSSMVASTGAIVYEKHRGTLKRIRASPTRPLNVLFGKTFAALLQTAISILIIAVLAYFLLAPKVNWNLPLMVPIMFLGSINGIALGLIISCVGKSPQAASGAATTVGIFTIFYRNVFSNRISSNISSANWKFHTYDLRSSSSAKNNDSRRCFERYNSAQYNSCRLSDNPLCHRRFAL